MKILKMYVQRRYGKSHYYCMVDEIPKITYEKIGSNYVGSATDDDSNIIFSRVLGYERFGDAFGGSELSLTMKDGSIQKIKDHWFDKGYSTEHGEFINIGIGTLESLQECYVYCGYNINEETFKKMLEDYYSREQEYEYYEIEKWAKKQYNWYPLICNGKEYPFCINNKGVIVEKYTKENNGKLIDKQVRILKYKLCFKKKEYQKEKRLYILKLIYTDVDGVIHRVELNMKNAIQESLSDIVQNNLEDILKKNATTMYISR